MTSTTRICKAAVVVLLLTGTAWAGTGPWCLFLAAEAVGPANPADRPPTDNRQKADDLLRRARQAMSENDLAAAETLVKQAEALDVSYGPFHLGDTPKRARRELERKRRLAAAPKPSRLFSPLWEGKQDVPDKDPFAGQSPDSRAAGAAHTRRLPPTGEPFQPMVAASGRDAPALTAPGETPYPATPPGAADPDLPAVLARAMRNTSPPANPAEAEAARNPLGDARKALAVGDVRRAATLVAQAQAQGVTAGPGDDSPQKVQEAIRKITNLDGVDKGTEAYRRAYARNLLEQADALTKYGALTEAEQLAHVAAAQRVMFTPYETKPQDVLGRVAALRHSGAAIPESAPPGPPNLAGSAAAAPPALAARQQALDLVRQAREELAAGRVERAEKLARKAETLQVPPGAFGPQEDRPDQVLLDIHRRRQQYADGNVMPARHEEPTDPNRLAAGAVYHPENDGTRIVATGNGQPAEAPPRPLPPTASTETVPLPDATGSVSASLPAGTLFEQGEAALRSRDKEKAYRLFQQAAARRGELDPQTAQKLQDRLQLLSPTSRTPALSGAGPNLAGETALRQQALIKQVGAELAHLEANARAVRNVDPKKSLTILGEARKKVEAAGLDATVRDQFLRRVDRVVAETEQFIEENRPRLELAEQNNITRADIERAQKVKLKKQDEVAQMIDQINQLINEQRFAEAQVLARRAVEKDPKNPTALQMQKMATMLYTVDNITRLKAEKEGGFMIAMGNVDEASRPFNDYEPYQMPPPEEWRDLTKRRLQGAERMRPRSEREIEIERKLKTPVSVSFDNAPLSEVIESLAKMADVNIFLDPRGLAEEAVATDTPVTIHNIHGDIALESALKLILEPLHLSFIIKDEVLKITSEQMRDGDVYTRTYNVADLVTPIPNFVPVPMGLDAAYRNAMAQVGFGGLGAGGNSAGSSPLAVLASHDGKGNSGVVNPQILAQINSLAGNPNSGSQPLGFGPGGAGGGAQADFTELIELITSTVRPDSWLDFGGHGSIREFPMNLSLVITQTQQVHEEIADLLEQLRRLQDLQVTIEVRFITLNDNFFERIGVDFDFDIHTFDWAKVESGFGSVVVPANPAAGTEPGRNTLSSERNKPATVGVQSVDVTQANGLGLYTSDLDIPFRQNSYGLAVPTFGGFDPAASATLGFAILSDLETYFFINAAQGDTRTNVLQAPKVTLFNGQQAMVSDVTMSPFVTGVIPVVGDFAAAQQPVIVVLSEGTFMTVQAVVSQDRRFVRLTVIPYFSKITGVDTFTFSGSETTTTDTTRDGNQTIPDANTKNRNYSSSTKSGVAVQLPSFSYVSVATTVSVPDGGTVLLGGIKRLSEGRNEYGVPMLNKIPYINRLFKNVGIGRETQSLMMMVTPRIIIQEEEEEALGVSIAARRKNQY
ncbi:MAG: hypothetical protein JXB10_14185 [Pirellulales bacterium]|nr:hypothetical protein [Pirellulales bacterium]